MLILDVLKVNLCGTREFNYNAQKTIFSIEHGGAHLLLNNPVHGWLSARNLKIPWFW